MNGAKKSYRLIVPGGTNEYQFVAFTAPSVASALWLARSYCGEGPGELFENGRRLGSLNGVGPDGIPLHVR